MSKRSISPSQRQWLHDELEWWREAGMVTTGQWQSNVLFFLGAFFYGAGIWLVAQIFHLNAHYPDGFGWWALGVLPLAVCLESTLLHARLQGARCEHADAPRCLRSVRRWNLLPEGAPRCT